MESFEQELVDEWVLGARLDLVEQLESTLKKIRVGLTEPSCGVVHVTPKGYAFMVRAYAGQLFETFD